MHAQRIFRHGHRLHPSPWQVTLDRTAFYPEGGGQACDTGTLGDAVVTDVQEKEEQLLHLCSKPLAVGSRVSGRIDFDRRFDLMQQHTGEHIVSGIIHARYGWQNSGFHVGKQFMEVDFDGPIPPEKIPLIEALANQVIWENRPVKCWYPSEEALAGMVYRTKRALPWPVRIVEVPDVDRCACCGIHVPFTGMAGPVKLISCVKFHQGVRIEMLCGKRAMAYMNEIFAQNKGVSQALSAKPTQTAEAAKKLLDTLAAEKFRCAGLEKQVFSHIAESYVNRGAVVHFEPGLSGAGLRELAEQIAAKCGGRAAVFSGEDGQYGYCLVQFGGDLRGFNKEMTAALCGRGGGKPEFQQGTLQTTRQQIEDFFQ